MLERTDAGFAETTQQNGNVCGWAGIPILYIGQKFFLSDRTGQQGIYESLYLDLSKAEPGDEDKESHRFFREIFHEYPYLNVKDVSPLIKRLRFVKQLCEIAVMREAEKITCAGITAIMRTSRPGMYEYQYKAKFDHALGQYGSQGPAFPSTISAGKNNFCMHCYLYWARPGT